MPDDEENGGLLPPAVDPHSMFCWKRGETYDVGKRR